MAGWEVDCEAGWDASGGEEKLSYPESDDCMMLVIMIWWQFLAGRLGTQKVTIP